jgi:hypothetical protein
MFLVVVVLMLVISTGCAAVPPMKQAANPPVCAPEAVLPADLVSAGGVILFGEIHGVKELPWFFGETVCSTARAGVPVAVGLEMPVSEQASVDSFLRSEGRSGDAEGLLEGPFWSRPDQDGRSSRARLDLLDRLRVLQAAGLPVRVFLFDVSAGSAPEHEKGMALQIAGQARAHANELILALVGDVHAWKAKGSPWDKEFVPMGRHLQESGVKVCSLGRSTPAGTAWTCKGSPMSCGPGEVPAFNSVSSGPIKGIELLDSPSVRGNDGLYAVATLSVSEPASDSRH